MERIILLYFVNYIPYPNAKGRTKHHTNVIISFLNAFIWKNTRVTPKEVFATHLQSSFHIKCNHLAC